MSTQQAPQQEKQSKSDGLSAIYFATSVHATTVTPLVRYGFGREGLGMPGFLAMLLMVFYASACARPMFIYLAIWLLAVIYQRIQTFRLLKKGYVIHSRYGGYPWLAMKFPFVRKERTAVFVEAMGCLVVGALLLCVSQGMGAFIMFGFISLMVRQGIDEDVARRRLQRMKDAEIEQRWMAERFRSGEW